MLEAVLIHFFARTYQGQLQSALMPTMPTKAASGMGPAAATINKPSASSVVSEAATESAKEEAPGQAHQLETSASSTSAFGLAASPHPYVKAAASSSSLTPPVAPIKKTVVTVEPANSCFDIDWAVSSMHIPFERFCVHQLL